VVYQQTIGAKLRVQAIVAVDVGAAIGAPRAVVDLPSAGFVENAQVLIVSQTVIGLVTYIVNDDGIRGHVGLLYEVFSGTLCCSASSLLLKGLQQDNILQGNSQVQ
jgi:hypothetical protein